MSLPLLLTLGLKCPKYGFALTEYGLALRDIDIPCEIKAISEELHKEVIEMRRELSKRLDQIEIIVRENRADLRAVQDRIDKIERKPIQ
jgi:hypothetical protein